MPFVLLLSSFNHQGFDKIQVIEDVVSLLFHSTTLKLGERVISSFFFNESVVLLVVLKNDSGVFNLYSVLVVSAMDADDDRLGGGVDLSTHPQFVSISIVFEGDQRPKHNAAGRQQALSREPIIML